MSYLTWILIHFLGLVVCGALLTGIANQKTNDAITKIPNFFRWLLTPLYGVICMALCEAILRFFTESFSIFWSRGDTESNIIITGYTLIPMFGMYGLCWGIYLMAPKFKENVVILFGSLLLALNLFLIFATGSLSSDVMVERLTQSGEIGWLGSIIVMIFYCLGFWMGINSSKGNSFWSIFN